MARYLPMSPAHWLGTTSSGRDVLSQVIHGARAALAVGLTAAVAVVAIGTLLGLLAGYLGGCVDRADRLAADVVLGLPFLPSMLVLAGAHPASDRRRDPDRRRPAVAQHGPGHPRPRC